jgi:gamma-glutamyl:cysteine ligase YbdK (ATP-grasp superfamily)
MGQEISTEVFTDADRDEYAQRLQQETGLLLQQIADGQFANQPPVAGFEIEGWLVDKNYHPATRCDQLLARLNEPLLTTELAQFNIELNAPPRKLEKNALTLFEQDLQRLLNRTDEQAAGLGCHLFLIGILPDATGKDFTPQNMTDAHRYRALNDQVLQARGEKPLELDISGREHLQLTHNSVMMESAATSFQIHIQVPVDDAHHFYNAAMMLSGPLLAMAGNSPFLLGHQLWEETRIPLFEQAVNAGKAQRQRVSFGSDFARHSITECFLENLQDYPVLLPMLSDKPAQRFPHLRLQNGTIWRWNRPLIGFDEHGQPHVRIEQRVLPAGPTVKDMLANAAFFYGLVQTLAEQLKHQDISLPDFTATRDNFYRAARYGLNTTQDWLGKQSEVRTLILKQLLPMAQQGLTALQLDAEDIDTHLGIIEARTRSGQTGARWQRQQLDYYKGDMRAMLSEYDKHQRSGQPIHTWPAAR